MKIIQSMLTKNRCYIQNKKITVKGLMLHSVGCPQPSAKVFVNSWNSNSATVCVHAFVEPNGDVYQTLPWEHYGWHCGASGNNGYIGVEMTEPNTIKYVSGSNWVELKDGKNTKAHVDGVYKTAVELFACLCKEYKLDPMKDGVILSHAEGHKRGIASNHGDPEHLFKKFGYTMDGFRKDVKDKMNEGSKTETKKIIYRVQVGAYSKKTNAENAVARLKKFGFDGMIIKDNSLYRVQVGAYSNKTNATNMMDKLKKNGFDCVLKEE